jgi:hypothetical protein
MLLLCNLQSCVLINDFKYFIQSLSVMILSISFTKWTINVFGINRQLFSISEVPCTNVDDTIET